MHEGRHMVLLLEKRYIAQEYLRLDIGRCYELRNVRMNNRLLLDMNQLGRENQASQPQEIGR